MALATTRSGEQQIVLSHYEPRIAASLAAWERHAGAVRATWPNLSCGRMQRITREIAGWYVVESRCVWADGAPTIPPFCDIVELVSAAGTRYLPFPVLAQGPAIARQVTVGEASFEVLWLADLSSEIMRELVQLAGDEPPPFEPR